MAKPFKLAQIRNDLAELAANAAHQLAKSEMQSYLGRDFAAYEREISDRETVVPKENLSGFGQNYAKRATDLLTRITTALNFRHITIGTETKSQLKRREEFKWEAEALYREYEDNFIPDPHIDIPQPYLTDHQYLVSYHDSPIGTPFNEAYQALEGYEVFISERPEDHLMNHMQTVNQIQQRWLQRLLDAEESVPETSVAKSPVREMMKKMKDDPFR